MVLTRWLSSAIRRPRAAIVVAAIAAACVLVVFASAWSKTRPPSGLGAVADTYVSAHARHANFGRRHELRIAARPADRVLIRFDLRAGAAALRSAVLSVDPLQDSKTGFEVAPILSGGSWDERRVTFASGVRVGAPVARSGPLRRHHRTRVDVSRLLGHGRTLQLALVATGRRAVVLASREAGGPGPRLLVGTTAPSGAPAPGNGTQPSAAAPCGDGGSPPATYDHVIWITFENQSIQHVIGNSSLPFTNQIAGRCGLATSFFTEAHPSLPNYIAMTSGGTQGVTGDSSGTLSADNVYNQVKQSGREWRHYAFGMPSNCDKNDSPSTGSAIYTAHHEPPIFYADLAADCARWDVGVGDPTKVEDLNDVHSGPLAEALDSNTLPAFATLGPTDDGGNSSAGGEVDPVKGDAFLARWIPRITDSAAYRAGRTAIFITWDEPDDFNTNPPRAAIPTIVIAPTVPGGTKVATRLDHYSLLRTTEEMLGLSPFLGAAATAPSMRGDFHI
jgi:hypothetical protein